MMPKIAEGDANKVWIVPSEIGKALEGLGSTMNELRGIPQDVEGPRVRVDMGSSEPDVPRTGDSTLSSAHAAVEEAIAEAQGAKSEEHTSELPSLMRMSYAVFCLKKKQKK